jgi:hypothetical protein
MKHDANQKLSLKVSGLFNFDAEGPSAIRASYIPLTILSIALAASLIILAMRFT